MPLKIRNSRWTKVDHYVEALLIPPDPVLDAALKASAAAGLPDIAVTPGQGKFLHLLARMHGARRILEIGTLGGYSTIWLARALPPDGRLVTLEADPTHQNVARDNITRAGLAPRVEHRLGLALETLPQLTGPFDFIFIDADKENAAAYFKWAMRLSRPGTAIVVDNVVRGGAVAKPSAHDSSSRGIHEMNEAIRREPRVTATVLQTVGRKGYDGFMLALVTD
ncbi:MAG TPA: O-methyltransferase [Acidobacteriaceae bacterium]|nr:O-methyltransferase [Acidobacteriaceae bacterium]